MNCPITQQHDFGCGVACVAFVSGVSYPTAVKILGIQQAESTGFWCKELVSNLNLLGLKYKVTYIKPRRQKRIVYTESMIVFIRRSKRYPFGHYLARYNGQWMDPWINLLFDKDIRHAKSGFRKRLPGKPTYAAVPV